MSIAKRKKGYHPPHHTIFACLVAVITITIKLSMRCVNIYMYFWILKIIIEVLIQKERKFRKLKFDYFINMLLSLYFGGAVKCE